MYKKTIFLYGGRGLQKRGSNLYNTKAKKTQTAMKSLDNHLLSMIKGVSLMSKLNKKRGGGAMKKNYGSGLKFIR
jgi:hypothetical protein